MPFVDTYPVRAAGPRTDLCLVYGRFTITNSGATITASTDTTPGLTITGDNGVYVLTHKKCRYRQMKIDVLIPALAAPTTQRSCALKTSVAGTDDAGTGILNFNTVENDATQTVLEPIDNSQFEVIGLIGF